MTDVNVWMALAAGITVLFQILVAVYFYGMLSQRVQMMQETADEQRDLMRSELHGLRDEIRNLRDKLYYQGYTRDNKP